MPMPLVLPTVPTALDIFKRKMLKRLVCLDMIDTAMVGVLLDQDNNHYLIAEDDSGNEVLVNARDVRAAWIMTPEDIAARTALNKEAQ